MKLKQVMIQAACATLALGTAAVAFAGTEPESANPCGGRWWRIAA